MSIQSTSNSSMYSDSYRLRKRIYYINTNEIPSKLLRENMIFAKYWCARLSIESMFRRQTKCLFNPTSHSSSTSESYKLRNIRVLHNNGIINDESLSAIWVPRIRSFYPLHFVTKLKIHHPSSSSLDHVKSIRFFFEWIKSHSPNLSTSVMSSLFVHLWTSLSFMLQQSLCNLKWESKFFTSDLLSKTLLY